MEDVIQPTTPPQVSAVPPAQNTPPYSYGKKNWKKWILIYVVIGVVLYGLVYYFVLSKQSSNPYSTNYSVPTIQPTQVQDASPAPNGTGETANWKTYTDDNIGFQIDYPSDYDVTPFGESTEGRYLHGFPQGDSAKHESRMVWFAHKNPDFDKANFSPEDLRWIEPMLKWDIRIEVGNINMDKTINEVDLKTLAEDYKKLQFSSGGGFPEDYGKIESVTVDGKSGYKISKLPGLIEYFIFLPSNKTNQAIFIQAFIAQFTDPKASTGEIANPPISPRYEMNKKVFDQILSTFKFTE